MQQNNSQNYGYAYPPQQPSAPPSIPIQPRIVTKNKFLTFVCACVPGAGQMYHGRLKRGVSLMVMFWGLIAVSGWLYIPWLTLFLPVLWFYSFFDTVNQMNTPIEELKRLPDDFLFFGESLDRFKGKLAKKNRNWGLLLGFALILIAVWAFLNMMFGGYYYDGSFWSWIMSERVYWTLCRMVDNIPSLLVPIICLVVGFKLIFGGHDKERQVYNEYTIPQEEAREK